VKRWAWTALAFAVLATVLTLCWSGGRGEELMLADGRGVSLVQATFGTRHELEEGSVLARLIAKIVGATRAQRFGYRSIVHMTPAPTLMVWTRWVIPTSNAPPRFASMRSIDGMETEPAHPVMDASAQKSPLRLMAWQFNSFPRRDASFQLRFHDRPPPYHTNPLGALDVRNPSPTNAPALGGHEAPVTVQDDATGFTLTRLEVGGTIPLWRKPGHSGLAPWTSAWFEVREGGNVSTNWTVREILIQGATGNFMRVSPLYVKPVDGLIETGFTAGWWRDEPDWTVTVVFGKAASRHPEEVWTLRGLPARGLQTVLATNFSAAALGCAGAAITLQPASPQSMGSHSFTRTTDLSLTYTSSLPRVRVELVQARDQEGRDLRLGAGTDVGFGRYYAGLELLPTTSSVDLTFGFAHGRNVDFKVMPRFSGTNAP
jgi:hypothetical protein